MSQLNGAQTRHVNAFNTLQFFFADNKTVYDKDASFKKWVDHFISNNGKIAPLSTTKGTNSKGVTNEKINLKTIIAQNGGYICSYVADYAVEIKDEDLYNIVN